MPDTTPIPLAAILTAAEDAKRAHDRLCDLAETLLPESSPVKTEDNPAPVVLPTVDEVEKAWRAVIARGERVRDAARAVLDLIADRVPVWVPVEPGTVIKAGTHYQVEHVASFDRMVDDGAPIFIDPRTVPAEPDAALIADLRQYVTSATSDDEVRDMIAAVRKADDARADQ